MGGYCMTTLRTMILALVSVSACRASDVVSIETPRNASPVTAQVDTAAHFYGLQVKSVFVEGPGDSGKVIEALSQQDTLAAVITEGALAHLDQTKVFSALRRSGGNNIPLLILDVGKQANARLLSKWSGGGVIGCVAPPRESHDWKLTIGHQKDITHQLAGVTLPFQGGVGCGLEFRKDSGERPLVQASDQGQDLAIFAESIVNGQDVFFLAQLLPTESASSPKAPKVIGAFSAIAPLMMFMRNSAGDRAWHAIGHYANLTIDDAWLTEPYGNLNYEALLGEMEKHNFHTTIAFIPWNFDRSKPNVVSLFRKHSDRFSICVHGNNHDHREFGDYRNSPLDEQASNLRQAIARMDKFSELTDISYDRVMVFPHGVAPQDTFAALKKYGFLATANSEYIPLGAETPDYPLFFLRTVTLEFANFPSLLRYSAEVPVSPSVLAIHSFLDNPVLFYGHEMLFHDGIGAFDHIADTTNEIQPGIRWCSMECISQHLYLIRIRQDGNVDVKAFTSDFLLENPYHRDALFIVGKQENFLPEIESITVDGRSQSYSRIDSNLTFSVFVPALESRHIAIRRRNDSNAEPTDISKRRLYVFPLRIASDFRDMTLSKFSWGHALVGFYYRHHFDSVELRGESLLPFFLLLAAFLGVARWLLHRKTKKSQALDS